MTRLQRRLAHIAGVLALCFAAQTALGGPQYALEWYSIDSGGGRLTDGATVVTGTIGQHDAGAMTGGGMVLCGGFICGGDVPDSFCLGDITGPEGPGVPDGNIDALDFIQVIAQWGSPGNCSPPCEADFTGPSGVPDGNVDVLDILLIFAYWGTPASCP